LIPTSQTAVAQLDARDAEIENFDEAPFARISGTFAPLKNHRPTASWEARIENEFYPHSPDGVFALSAFRPGAGEGAAKEDLITFSI
jgi:hypothetical protein